VTWSFCLNAAAAGYDAAWVSSFDAVWSSFCPETITMGFVPIPFQSWTARLVTSVKTQA